MNRRAAILAALILATVSGVAEARYCNNPNCAMCNRIFGPMRVQQRSAPRPAPRPVYRSAAPQSATKAADTTLVPSSPEVVQAVMDLANIREGDAFADLGCGDGRFLPAAIKRGAHFAIGIEIDPQTAELARRNTAEIPGVFIVEADVRQVSLERYGVMTMYLFPESMPSLETMKPGAVILSISHPIPNVPAQRVLVEADGKQHPVYVYRKPLEAP